jgi:GxxExxY protein
MTKKQLRELEYDITGACIEVHRNIGPGLLESVYHKCLAREFQLRNIRFSSEMMVKVFYKDIDLETDLRVDFFVEQCIVLELKAVEKILPIHEAQILTYMKLTECPKGLLVNFNCTNIIVEGKKSYVNSFYTEIPD